MCDINKGSQSKGEILEDLPSNEVLLAHAAETREAFYTQTLDAVRGMPEKQKGKSLLVLEMRRRSAWRNRGIIPK